MRKIIFLMSIFAAHLTMAQQQSSPDGSVMLSFSLKSDGTPSYKVTYKNKPVINESTLGFTLKKAEPYFQRNLETCMGGRKRNP